MIATTLASTFRPKKKKDSELIAEANANNYIGQALQKAATTAGEYAKKAAQAVKSNASVTAPYVANSVRNVQSASGGGYPSFSPSQSYLQAMEYTNSLLEKLNTGRTSYTDKVQAMLSAIENKGPFQYDFNTDPLFQSQLQSAMNKGQIAMQDTMGQAAALTGGYGSSYAQAVGNQAYNGMIQGAYDNLPDYYNMAMDAYNSELANMYNKLDMYNTADEIEYDRMANAYANSLANANMLYDMDVDRYNRSLGAYNASAKASAKTPASTEEVVELKQPTAPQMQKLLKAYNEGGEEAYFEMLDSFPDNIDVDYVDSYIQEWGQLPLQNRTYTNVKDTFNWLGGPDRNDRVQDQYGNEYSIIELRQALMDAGMTKAEANDYIKKNGLSGKR